MKILALDLGKFKSVGCVYDTESQAKEYATIKMVPFAVHNLIATHTPDRVVFEIGPSAGWVHDVALQSCRDVQVANPTTEGWRWRNVKAKTDRLDALKLARLSAAGQLPQVHVPSPQVRQRRGLIGYRHTLVARRTRIKNRIRSLLQCQGLGMPRGARGWRALRYNPQMRAVYERICGGSKSRRKIAIVAVARRLLVTAWAMLRDETPWRAPQQVVVG